MATSQISKTQMQKFMWEEGDITFGKTISIPKYLKPIIDDIPQDDTEALQYLQKKVKDEELTTDEFRFILLSTADGGPYIFE